MSSRATLLALGGAVAIAFTGVLVRLADVAPASAAFWRCVYALPFLAVLALLERRKRARLDRRRHLLALAAGVFFAADLELWHHSIEAVGAGYNRQLLTDMLRGRYGFRGIVVTDWAVTWDCNERCKNGAPADQRPSFADLGMPWGVEELSMRARFVKAVKAGVDQFGGTERADMLADAVRAGELRWWRSARRGAGRIRRGGSPQRGS